MTTWYSQGSASGADYGGFFGPALSSITNAPFLVTWTGTDCNCYSNPPFANGMIGGPITGAVLTINGISLNLNQYNNIGGSEWLDQPGQKFLDLQLGTAFQQLAVPPFTIPPGGTSSYTLGTYTSGPYVAGNGIDAGGYIGRGVAYLYDTNHPYQSDIFLDVFHMGPHVVPGPDIATGIPGLILAISLIGWWLWRGYCGRSRIRTSYSPLPTACAET